MSDPPGHTVLALLTAIAIAITFVSYGADSAPHCTPVPRSVQAS